MRKVGRLDARTLGVDGPAASAAPAAPIVDAAASAQPAAKAVAAAATAAN